MDYLTLKKHCLELSQALSDKPLVARAFPVPGRGFCLRLKRASGISDLVFQLEQSVQGCWLTDESQEIDRSCTMVRQIQRLLINGRILAVSLFGNEENLEFDRVLKFQIAVVDSFFGNRSDYFIVCEFTGRIANIFICDNDMKIIDRLAQTSNNSVGNTYRLPDSNYTINPFVATTAGLEATLNSPHQSWAEKIGGFSPQVAKELAARTRTEKTISALARELKNIFSQTDPQTYVAFDQGKVKALSGYFPGFVDKEKVRNFASVSKALEFIENEIAGQKRFNHSRQRVLESFNKDLKHREQIVFEQQKLRDKYQNSEQLQKMGNLIVANIYRITPGISEIEVDDWESGEKLKIKLDPTKSPAAQAQKFFHRFKKAQRGIKEVEKRISSLREEIVWLREQIWLTENATCEADLPEIETAVARQNRHKADKASAKRKKYHFKPTLEIDGCRYYVGKNGRQNDILTFNVARKNDRWFHANDVPGAHVILKKPDGEIEEKDLLRGALLAAWFSFARQSSKVAVDTTQVAHVKKIPGGGPGRVSYTHQNTLYVNPQQAAELVASAESQSGENQ
jgi:predicted ribosome quality control (RQC) complex YloA/Tae2 family protein